MKKLVFFDIDGTLTTESNYIPQTTIQAIQQLKEKGIQVVLATGRPPLLIEPISKALDIHNYIAMNGQYIVYEDEVIYANPIEERLVDQVVNFANHRKDGVILCAENELIINSRVAINADSFALRILKRFVPLIPERIQKWTINQVMKKGPTKADYQDEEIYMINLNVLQHNEQAYKNEFNDLHFTRANPYSMDIINEGVSKASAVEKMLSILQVDAEHTLAFGDGLNDLEMLQFVGTGVAMGNGFEELKAAADYVTADVADKGIPKALRKLGVLD